VLVSGGTGADPRTPVGLPGLPPPFLGTAVVGDGELTAAVDAYGNVVDLRAGPAGRALIENPAERQAAGSVAADTGIVPRVVIDEEPLPLWRADSVTQRYLPGTNVVRTVAWLGRVRVTIDDAAAAATLARTVDVSAPPGVRAEASLGVRVDPSVRCARSPRPVALVCSLGIGETTADLAAAARQDGLAAEARRIIAAAAKGDRGWIARARPLAPRAPRWARGLYRRSLLTLRALSDRGGAVAAGARDGWAYVWPRDAGTAALALASAGYRPEARRVARFLFALDLGAAARFEGDGTPTPGREAQGDASGWVAVAARAANLPPPHRTLPWRERADYQERTPGTYLANAIAASATSSQVDGPQIRLYGGKSAHQREAGGIERTFTGPAGLVRRAGDPASGLDSAAAWAVRPFPLPELFPAVRETLLRLAAEQTPFGITPAEDWPGTDPWTAPTAWTAWSLAALGERRGALRLLGALRRASTPAGALPERVDVSTGVPVSTTPLAWPHAFAILALRQLWP